MANRNKGGGNSNGGGGGISLDKVANNLLSKFGLGGYTAFPPGRDQVGTWQALGEVTASGSTVQQNGQMWGSGNNLVVTVGSAVQSILMEAPLQQGAQNAAPVFRRITIKALDGQIDIGPIVAKATGTFTNPVNSGYTVNVSIGMYMGRFNPDTGLYSVQDAGNPADVSRYDWIYLESRLITFILDAQQTVWLPQNWPAPKLWDLTKMDFEQVFGPGEALMLSTSVYGGYGITPVPALSTGFVIPFIGGVRGLMVRGS